jgi:hypothetical protein
LRHGTRVIGLWFALLGLGCGHKVAAMPKTGDLAPKEACMTTLHIESHRSLLEEVRSLGVPARDFPKDFPAQTPSATEHRPLKAGGAGPGGEALFWLDAEGTPFVDARVFGPLKAVSVPSLDAGVTATVGQVVAKPMPALAVLVRQLIETDVIGTYVHLESSLCLKDIPGGVHVTGTHTYMTNTENIDPLDFKVTIDPTGLIEVSSE